mmetsp:Transcript_101995/g.179617  ORF Transcript_101995/g.179617 Transcript_101995/m.179617 type:complete len:269 (+) Transcript_101995:1-807(+)
MPESIFPEHCTEVLPNLYLGDVTAARQIQQLVDRGVHAVVCCVREQEFPETDFHEELEYCRVDVEDVSREPIELFWPEATEFIHCHISHGRPVLVHCRAGVSRSASTVLAYMVQHRNYSLHDAFFHLRAHRPIVTPNLGFMEKLCEFEAQTRQMETTICYDSYKSWYSGNTLETVPILAVRADDAPHESMICQVPAVISAIDCLEDITNNVEIYLDLPVATQVWPLMQERVEKSEETPYKRGEPYMVDERGQSMLTNLTVVSTLLAVS